MNYYYYPPHLIYLYTPSSISKMSSLDPLDPLDEVVSSSDEEWGDEIFGPMVPTNQKSTVIVVTEYYSDGEPVKLVFHKVSVDGNNQLDGIHHTLDEAVRNKFEGIVTKVIFEDETKFTGLLQDKHKYIVFVEDKTEPKGYKLRGTNSPDDL